jgi:MYXO-CTERM domain-containing protein
MVDNGDIDGARDFTVDLLVPTGGAVLGDRSRLTVTILDDDVGADLEVVSLTFQQITSDITEFAGLTAGFNDLRYRHRVVAQVRNNGQAAVSNFSIELLVPKDHLAGYGQTPGSNCEVLTVDPADPVYVHVACTGLALDPGASINLPDRPFYVGYASVVPRNAGYTYSAAVRTLGASVRDTSAANDSRSAVLVPRESSGSGSGGGSMSPAWLAVLGLLIALRRRRSYSSMRAAQEVHRSTAS